MILTKVKLDLRSPSARQALTDCGDMHRNIQALFGESREDAGVLYRAQKTERGCTVFILSSRKPVFDEASARSGMIPAGTRDMTAVEGLFAEGRRFRFDLLTMPSKKESDRTRKNSQRRILRDPEERLAWLARKRKEIRRRAVDSHDAVHRRSGDHGSGPFPRCVEKRNRPGESLRPRDADGEVKPLPTCVGMNRRSPRGFRFSVWVCPTHVGMNRSMPMKPRPVLTSAPHTWG